MAEKRHYFQKYHLRRYKAKPFRNPYFRDQKDQAFRIKNLLMLLGGLGVTAGFVYLIGFAPFWQIKGVQIDGLQSIAQVEVADLVRAQMNTRRYLIFPESNRLFFHARALTETLAKKYAFEELQVEIEKGILHVTLKERISQLLWDTDDATYFIDVQGTVIRQLPADDAAALTFHDTTQPIVNGRAVEGPYPRLLFLHSLPLLENEDGKAVVPGDRVLSESSLAAIIAINEKLQSQGLIVQRFAVEHQDSVWVRVVTSQGFDVLFDTAMDVDAQMGYLMTVLEKDAPDPSLLDYVDVRFGNHVYFKNK